MSERLTLQQVGERLKAPPAVVHALAMSGLLGYWENGGVPEAGVLQFERFGTQWRPELGSRSFSPDPFRDLPAPPGVLGGDQPPSTGTEVQIAPSGIPLELSEKDTGWIAQFFVQPNPFFFASPEELALVGPVGMRLSRRMQIPGTDYPCYLYPDPEGRFAMAMVIGDPRPHGDPIEAAYDIASPALDALAFEYDQPLPICQRLIVGIPSGIISVWLAKPSAPADIAEGVLKPRFEVPDLWEAVALYREGVSSNNPFHQFLTLWKAYENACGVRGHWRKKHRRRDHKEEPEEFPPMFAWSEFSGKTFDQAKQQLNDSHRIALAHGDVRGGSPRTGATWADVRSVSAVVPVIRYMARVTIRNVRATFGT